MTGAPLSLAISLFAGDLPPARRVARAAAAGYRVVESWWPWSDLVPEQDVMDAFAVTFAAHDVRLHLLNLAEGPARWGGRGLAGVPQAEAEFWANADAALRLGQTLGVRHFNVLAGNVQVEGRAAGLAVLEDRLTRLAARVERFGAGLVLEQLNPDEHPDYLLSDPGEAVAFVRRLGLRNVGMLADVYHLARSGVDPAPFVAENVADIRHVQLADFPGRGRPGTGGVAINLVLAELERAGYAGMVGLEYLPDGAVPPPESLWRQLTD